MARALAVAAAISRADGLMAGTPQTGTPGTTGGPAMTDPIGQTDQERIALLGGGEDNKVIGRACSRGRPQKAIRSSVELAPEDVCRRMFAEEAPQRTPQRVVLSAVFRHF